jgi:oligoribonuclease (3'-5' exoribonuclease)
MKTMFIMVITSKKLGSKTRRYVRKHHPKILKPITHFMVLDVSTYEEAAEEFNLHALIMSGSMFASDIKAMALFECQVEN